MAKQFAFKELSRDRGAVERDERFTKARTVEVDRPGDQLLTSAAFTVNENRYV